MNGMPHTVNRVLGLISANFCNHGQQNQRGCLLSTGPLYYLYFLGVLIEVFTNVKLEFIGCNQSKCRKLPTACRQG